MKLPNKENIEKEYFNIIDSLSKFSTLCNDANTFSLSGNIFNEFKKPIELFIKDINNFNENTIISGNDKIDLGEIIKSLCDKLCKIPNLVDLLDIHTNRALHIINNYENRRASFQGLSDDDKIQMIETELPVFHSALKLRDDPSIRDLYSKINSEISDLKDKYCFNIKASIFNSITFKKDHQDVKKLDRLSELLIDLNYLDIDNCKLFISFLMGNYSGKVINWKTNKANVSRLIYTISRLLSNSPKWKELEKLFTIKGKGIRDLRTGAKPKNNEFEESVNKIFDLTKVYVRKNKTFR